MAFAEKKFLERALLFPQITLSGYRMQKLQPGPLRQRRIKYGCRRLGRLFGYESTSHADDQHGENKGPLFHFAVTTPIIAA
jgi:hypothetical protein